MGVFPVIFCGWGEVESEGLDEMRGKRESLSRLFCVPSLCLTFMCFYKRGRKRPWRDNCLGLYA